MFGLWILVFIFAPIGVASIAIASIALARYKSNRRRLVYKDKEGYEWTYTDASFDRKHCPPEDLPRVQKAYKRMKFWDWLEDEEGAFYVIGGICLIAAVILLFAAIFVPIGAMQEYAYWHQFAPMAEEILASSNQYQTIGIADEIIEYNTWLAKARASQETYGNWSQYYKLDLSQLDYIRMGQ